MAAAPPSSPDSTHPPPRMVGRYAIYGEIAKGGMATVHFGRLLGPVGFSRTVAIKRLHPQYAADAEFVAMFLDEARLAARVQHPNVVSTLDVVALDGELMLVMEYVQGEALSRIMSALRARNERIPFRIVGALINSMLAGLHAAHEAKNERKEPLGIVHRDMSPQNVLVGADGVIRVFDFGIAKAAGRAQDTRAGTFKGKLAYAAPEQLSGLPVDRRADVYAASVVLWEMVTNRRMFKADDEMQLYAMVKEGRIEPPSKHVGDLPPGLEALILRGLATDPAYRFASAREMAIALEEVLPHASVREVAEWVARVAKPVLDSRARQIEEIETTNPLLPVDSGVRDLPTVPRGSLPPSQPPAAHAVQPANAFAPAPKPSDAPLAPQGFGTAPFAPTEVAAPPAAFAEPASGPVSHVPGVPKRRRGVFVVLAALIVLASAGGGLALAYLRTSSDGPTVVEEETKTTTKPKPKASVAPLPDPDPDPEPVASVEPAKPTPPKGPATPPKAVASAPPSAPEPKAPAPASASKAAAPASTPAAPVANCTPPFTIDSEGIRHPKPECM